LNGTKRK